MKKSKTFHLNSYFNHLILLLMLALLSACGGGGGGGAPADDSSTSSSVSGVQLNGTASKGILNGGVVTAEELDSSGNAIATLATTTTAADGSYSLTLSDDYTGGPVQVSISVDANTQMKCDSPVGCGTRTDSLTDTYSPLTIDFGEWYKPASFTMTALVPDAEANATISVSVTPFTHMAAARARAAATLDSAAVANANSEVSNLLGGIDILNTAPVDITDPNAVDQASSEVQVTYAALASSLSNQGLVDSNGQPDLGAAMDLLAASFTSGVIKADDNGDGDDAAEISMQEILTATRYTFSRLDIDDLTGKLNYLEYSIDTAGADGLIVPEPSSTATDPALNKVKAMMSDVRTWANVIEEETRARRTVFNSQVELAADAINIGTDDLGNAFHASIEAAFNFTAGNNNLDNYILGAGFFDAGAIDSPEPGVIEIVDGEINGYTVNMTIHLPENETTDSSFSVGIASAVITSPDNSLTINTGLVNVTFAEMYTVDYEAIDLDAEASLPDPTDLTFDLDVEFTQYVDSSGNELPSPVSFAGTMFFDLDVIPVYGIEGTEIERLAALPNNFELSGELSNTEGDSLTASLVINIRNTEDAFYFVEDVTGNIFNETVDNWIDAKIGLTFIAQLSGLPEARVNIEAERTGFEAGNGSITISYGTRQIVISGSTTNMNDIDGVVTITNQDSVVLAFSAEDEEQPLDGTLSYNGIQYATVSETDRGYLKVSYIDGTFEIF